jgi:hypothetical protein
MPAPILFGLGLFVLLLEMLFAQIFAWHTFATQGWLIIALWLAMRPDFASSSIILAGLLPFMLIGSGAPSSYWIPGVVLVFLAVRPLGLSPRNLSKFTIALLAAGGCLLHAIVMILVIVVFSPGSRILASIVWNLLWAVPTAAIITPIGFWVLEKVEEKISPRQAGIRLSK